MAVAVALTAGPGRARMLHKVGPAHVAGTVAGIAADIEAGTVAVGVRGEGSEGRKARCKGGGTRGFEY